MRNLHLFTAGTATSVGASGNSQLITTGTLVPLGRNVVKLANAFVSLSPADNSGKLNVTALAIFVLLTDLNGTALTTEAMPVDFLPVATLPTMSGAPLRYVARKALGAFRFSTASEAGMAGVVAQVGVQAIAVLSNTDGAGAHSATLSVGQWWVFEDHDPLTYLPGPPPANG